MAGAEESLDIGSHCKKLTAKDAKSAIVYDITVPPVAAIRTTPLRIALDTTIPKDSAVDARVQQWLAELAVKLGGNETIGKTQNLLEGVEPVIRGRESALGNLLTDVEREHMQTDVAVLNGGSIRINDNIVPGPITTYDLEGIFYYQNTHIFLLRPMIGAQDWNMLGNEGRRSNLSSSFAVYAVIVREWNRRKQ